MNGEELQPMVWTIGVGDGNGISDVAEVFERHAVEGESLHTKTELTGLSRVARST